MAIEADSYRFSSWLHDERIYLLQSFNCGYRPSIIAMHFAAIEIQRIFRGYQCRCRFQLPNKPLSSSTIKPIPINQWSEVLNTIPQLAQRNQQLLLVNRYLNYIRHNNSSIDYMNWIATKLQSWWRMCRIRKYYLYKRHAFYSEAAQCIQLTWKHCLRLREEKNHWPQTKHRAALRIQKIWRSYMDRKIYQYYRDLIRFRERGNTSSLIRTMNAREYELCDDASSLHIRFRLGGHTFPPFIYYKIYTQSPIVDINAFAPRNYNGELRLKYNEKRDFLKIIDELTQWHRRGRKDELTLEQKRVLHQNGGVDALNDRANWYCRVENNGWRPIEDSILMDDYNHTHNNVIVTHSNIHKRTTFHYRKIVRQQDVQRRRKLKRLNWLRRMYGFSQDHINNVENDDIEDVGDDECNAFIKKLERLEKVNDDSKHYESQIELDKLEVLEDEAEKLLSWSDNLDFDMYIANWSTLGTSGWIDKSMDSRKPSIQQNIVNPLKDQQHSTYNETVTSFYTDSRPVTQGIVHAQ